MDLPYAGFPKRSVLTQHSRRLLRRCHRKKSPSLRQNLLAYFCIFFAIGRLQGFRHSSCLVSGVQIDVFEPHTNAEQRKASFFVLDRSSEFLVKSLIWRLWSLKYGQVCGCWIHRYLWNGLRTQVDIHQLARRFCCQCVHYTLPKLLDAIRESFPHSQDSRHKSVGGAQTYRRRRNRSLFGQRLTA